MWTWLADTYQARIVETGREPLALLLLGLVGSFLLIRFSVRMIRRGTRWWPGNITPGGLHIHHMVFGQALLLITGVASFVVDGGGGLWNVLAVGFGIGCGLVLDEFALALYLQDVYWSEQGRKSVDAVILATALIGLLLVGALPLGGFSGPLTLGQAAVASVLLLCVAVSLFKGKLWVGLLGIMAPPLALAGAIRLARPGSPWARWRYRTKPKRLARAERRETRVHGRVTAIRYLTYNLLAGAPDPQPAPAPSVPAPASAPAPPAGTPQPLPRWRAYCATFSHWYLRVVTALNLLAGLITPFRDRVRHANTGEYFTPVMMTAGFTAALLTGLLAVMLRRRKRAAWIVTTTITALYAVLVLAALACHPEVRRHSFNWVSATVTVLFLAALLLSRRAAHVRGELRNLVLGPIVLVLGGALVTALGALLIRLSSTEPVAGWSHSLRYAARLLFTTATPERLGPGVEAVRWAAVTTNLLGTLLLLLVLRLFLRSPHNRKRLQPDDEQRLRSLLNRHGARDSLGYFALRRDKSVIWSPSGKAAVLYRVVNGVALASGDPIGDPEAWPQAIEVWHETTRANAWISAVTGASERASAVYARAGLKALEMGDEAVVRTADFNLEGRSMRTLRQAHNRALKTDHRVVLRRHRDIPQAELDGLVHLADAWRHGAAERGFSMALGRLGDPADGDCLMAECRDENDRTCALLSFVPWGANGLSLDLMRRDRESDNGLIEFIVTELLLRAQAGELLVERVSLNFAMFRSVFERGARIGAGPVLRRWRATLLFLSRWWQLESLYRANSKYQPDWEPRFMLYENPSELFAIAFADATAEGFLNRPRLPRLRGPGTSGQRTL